MTAPEFGEALEPSAFSYSNLSDRPPGRFITLAGRIVPGVARVQRDVRPYADAWAESNRVALRGSGPLWIALGDSLSQGIGASRYDRGWVGQLRDRLTASGRDYRVVNLSVTGARTRDVLDKQLPALTALSAEHGAPALVTLMIGSNDIFSRSQQAGLAERYAQILAELPAGSVVTQLPDGSAAATEVNAVIERTAARRNLIVAPLKRHPPSYWRGKLAADHFHPNDAGYALLADVFARAII